jgi:hypothetical protein
MSKKSDMKNLADAYDSMLLNEAVKPTESNEPAKPLTPEEKAFGERARANGKNWTEAQTRLMFQRQNEINAQGTNSSTTQTQQPQPSQLGGSIGAVSKGLGSVGNVTQPTTQPVQPTQNNDDEGWEEVETTVERIPNVTQTYTSPSANQAQRQPLQLGGAVGSVSKGLGSVGNVTQPTQTNQPVETTVERIPNATQTTSIAAGDDEFEQNDEDESDDEGYEEVETTVERIPNASTTTSIVAGDDEIKPYHKKIQEKINISKFLKHLSEKNYSSAHKYLKAIVDDKVKTKIAQRIAKI